MNWTRHGFGTGTSDDTTVWENAPEWLRELYGTPLHGYVDHESIDGQLFLIWDALNQVTQETEHATFGKPRYDSTLDHLHDVAEGAKGLVDAVRERLAGLATEKSA